MDDEEGEGTIREREEGGRERRGWEGKWEEKMKRRKEREGKRKEGRGRGGRKRSKEEEKEKPSNIHCKPQFPL